MAVATRREAMAQVPAPASEHDITHHDAPHQPGGARAQGATSSPTGGAESSKAEHGTLLAAHPGNPERPHRARVYVLTYFFSSLTIERWRVLWGAVPIGWIVSSLVELFGMPICHTNVQV